MKKLLLVDKFLSQSEFHSCSLFADRGTYLPSPYGEDYAVNYPVVVYEKLINIILNDSYRLTKTNIIRKPTHNIHYEPFETDKDWIFINALKPTTFNLFAHKSGAEHAGHITNLNFKNFTEFNYTTNIILEKNQGLFFRPWLFHSIQGGLIQYFRLTK